MAIFRRKDNKQREAELDDDVESYDQYESEEMTEAIETEEDEQPIEGPMAQQPGSSLPTP